MKTLVNHTVAQLAEIMCEREHVGILCIFRSQFDKKLGQILQRATPKRR